MPVQISPNSAWDVVLLKLSVASSGFHQLKAAIKNHEGLVAVLQRLQLGRRYQGGIHRLGFLLMERFSFHSVGYGWAVHVFAVP